MTILGIDLGTTNSACGIWTEEGVKLIPNRLGETLTPSIVGLDSDNKITVGAVALERLIIDPTRTVGAFKRLMGSTHKIKLGNQSFTATELSALILMSLKEDAETYLGEKINEAVISVPAYFNDHQRQATKTAGELAGFKVERLINEPTAAAMAYGLHDQEEGYFMILDMGGGTFDVSILEYFEGIMEVHASAGDNYLGGEDFVENMMDKFLSEKKINKANIKFNEKQKIVSFFENLKKEIDSLDGKTLNLKINDKNYNCDIDKNWFEKISTPLLLKARRPIEQALRDANLRASELDNVILVGGATKMRIFRNMVSRLLGRIPTSNINPDIVVAMGASIQAGLKSQHKLLDDLVLTDVCPYTLGTSVVNESGDGMGLHFLPIIERNSIVPISISRVVFTASDNQTNVLVRIYQGENRYANKNINLGELSIKVPSGPAGKEEIEIRYSYDMNGILEVDVEVLSTGHKSNIVIENAPGTLSDHEKKKARERLSQIKFHPRESEANREVVNKGERLYEMLLGESREYVSLLLSQFSAVLERQNQLEIEKVRRLTLIEFEKIDGEKWL